MANHMGLIGCLVVAAALLQCATAQTAHVVGGSVGWTIPSNSSVYPNWAAGETFKIGDTLVFNFATGAHNVAKVSKTDYDACTNTSPISSVISTGPAKVRIDSAGGHYYICTVGTHCQNGQKLNITAAPASSGAPTTAPAPTPSGSPAPSSSPTTPTPAGSPAPSSSSAAPTPAGTSTAPAPTTGGSPPSSSPPAPTTDGSPSSSSPQAPTTNGSPAPGSPTGGPPAPSSTSTLTVGGYSVVLLLIAIVFLH